MTQVAERALDVVRLLPHLVCDRKVGRADAFPHAEDLPPVPRAALPPEPKLERASDGQGSKDSTRYLDGLEKEVAFCFPCLKTWGPRCSFNFFPAPLLGDIRTSQRHSLST